MAAIGKAEKGSAAQDRVAWGDGRGGNAKWGARGWQHDAEKARNSASKSRDISERDGETYKETVFFVFWPFF
jgi:hypothetical protein